MENKMSEDVEAELAELQALYRKPGVFTDWGVGTIMMTAGLDQAIKWWIIEQVMGAGRGLGFFSWYTTPVGSEYPMFDPVAITPFFNLVMVWNRGVSFGLMNERTMFIPDVMNMKVLSIITISLLICSALTVWIMVENRRFPVLAMGLIIGGAIGNIIDRIRFQAVADFFDFHIAGYHWPAFNIADMAIVIGVCLVLYDTLFLRPKYEEGGT